MEREGFVASKAGKGTFVLAGNKDLIEDTKRVLIEEKLIDLITFSKILGISIEELHHMLDILKIRKVSKNFERLGLNNINLNIKENCITGFLEKMVLGKLY